MSDEERGSVAGVKEGRRSRREGRKEEEETAEDAEAQRGVRHAGRLWKQP
jgi:hypothetical protein